MNYTASNSIGTTGLPTAYPDDCLQYEWNEATLAWDLVE